MLILKAAMLDDMNLDEIFLFIGQLCKEGELGWWTWHETMQQNVFVYLVFGLMTSDLMIGNPGCGACSVLKSSSPCHNCGVNMKDLDNPNYNISHSQKTPQLIDGIRTLANQ